MKTPETEYVVEWTSRMARRYGGIVYDDETGRQWDWGQALCREVYGPDWMNSPEFKKMDEAGGPFAADVKAAEAWEAGAWPEWARLSREQDSHEVIPQANGPGEE